ncbi:MAG: response regulator [Burkholderiaceae bacterium]
MDSLVADRSQLEHAAAVFELKLLSSCAGETDARFDAAAAARLLQRCQALLSNFARFATAGGARGLHQACQWVQANIELVGKQARPLSDEQSQALEDWPSALRAYLETPGDRAAIESLLVLIDAPCWPFRPSRFGRDSLATLLSQFHSSSAGEAHADPSAGELLAGSSDGTPSDAVQASAAMPCDISLGCEPIGSENAGARDFSVDSAAPLAESAADASNSALRLAIEALKLAATAGVRRERDRELYGAALDAVIDASATAGCNALVDASLHVAGNLDTLNGQPDLIEGALLVLLDFPIAMLDCVVHPNDRGSTDVLLACLSDPMWPVPLSTELLHQLRAQLLEAANAAPDPARTQFEPGPNGGPPELISQRLDFEELDSIFTDLAPLADSEDEVEPTQLAQDTVFSDLVPWADDDSSAAQEALETVFTDLAPLGDSLDAPAPSGAGQAIESPPGAEQAIESPALPPLPAGLQECDPENLELLAAEFAAFAATLQSELAVTDPAREPSQRHTVLSSCGEMLDRFASVSQAVGLSALHWVFAFVARRIALSVDTGLDGAQRHWIDAWAHAVRGYLSAPGDASAATGIVETLCDAMWPDALDALTAIDLESALAALTLLRAAGTEPRPTSASADAMSLLIPSDVNAELLESLVSELPVQTAEFAGAVQRIAAGTGSANDIDAATRAAHTLKGAANTVGVRGIANLTHHLEDILIALGHHGAMPPRAACEVLSRAADCLEEMSEAVLNAESAPADAVSVFQQVLDWANHIDALGAAAFASQGHEAGQRGASLHGPGSAESHTSLLESDGELDSPAVRATPALAATGAPAGVAMLAAAAASAAAMALTPAPAAGALADPGAETPGASVDAGPTLRVPATVVDELLRLVGETMIANTQIKEQLRLSIEHTRAVTRHNRQLQRLTGELEQLVDVRGVASPAHLKSFAPGPVNAAPAHASRPGAQADFDALEFEHYNELQTVTRHLAEAATDSRELSAASEERLGALADLLETQGRLHQDNQSAVMKTRMVTVGTIESRLQRSVRQTCRLLDKAAELHVRGANTSIDSNVLNELVDPLMHVLRNAVDHGIESPEARARAGKPATGRIDLSFTREGAAILVRCSDDGAGLDFERILAKARERKLIAQGVTPSPDELARLTLVAGFSTRDAATQVSGRGIGLDAVNERVQSLKGVLRISSGAGGGTSVEMRLPVSLMTTNGLLIKVGGQTMAVSSYGIQDIHYVTQDRIRRVGNALFYQNGDQVHPLDNIDALLGRADRRDDADGNARRNWFPALLVRTDEGQLRAIRVHDVLDSQELVVKDLGRFVAKPRGVIGVTILGDGGIAPVLDLGQLLRAPAAQQRSVVGAGSAASPIVVRTESRRSALVVDDSLSARRAAAQFLKDAGFDVRSAMDGVEAAAMIEKLRPDIVLVDMEMPRMNGLELTSHLRAREATRELPIIMITSRSTEKHRTLAKAAGVDVYVTKPFDESDLLTHIERLTAAALA